MKYLILGVNGMAGHIIAQYLLERGHQVEGVARRRSEICSTIIMDVCQWDKLKGIITEGKYDYVINAVGVLNKKVEESLSNGIYINSMLPHLLDELTKTLHTGLIHISTDCVFDGKKGNYEENSFPDAETWYGRTKALGEVNDDKSLTIRTSIVGPELNNNGIGLFHWFMNQEKYVTGYGKVLWSGVTTLELAKAIESASVQKVTGLYHLVNNEKISKYELLKLFSKYCRRDTIEIIWNEDVVSDKTLVNTRTDFEFAVGSYENMVKEMAEWISTHKVKAGTYEKVEVNDDTWN